MKKMIALLLVLALAGCSTFVNIRTDPKDAKLYINDEPKGETPFYGDLSDGLFARYLCRIEAPGYKPLYVQLSKELKWGAFIAGWFFYVPWLWASGPKPFYSFELQQE